MSKLARRYRNYTMKRALSLPTPVFAVSLDDFAATLDTGRL